MQQSLLQREIKLLELRDYQQKMRQDTYEIVSTLIRSGKPYGSIMNVLATGGGKTFVMCRYLIDLYLKTGEPSLFIVDQDRLVRQTVASFQKYGVEPGVIKAGYRPTDAPFQVASIQTLIRREMPRAGAVVIDEAHTSFAPSYRPVFEKYADKWIFGCTATPFRTKKGESLGDFYQHLVLGPSAKNLIEIGRSTNFTEGLVEPIYYGFSARADLSGVRTTAGDYNKQDLKVACNRPEIIERIPKEWLPLAAPDGLGMARRTIAFCIDKEHSQAVSDEFNRQGIPSRYVHSGMDDDEIAVVFEEHRAGKFIVLCSVDMIIKGFDDPEVSCVIWARPTKSLVVYIQSGGRGLRVAPWIGKRDCIFLDVAGNFGIGDRLKFGPLETERKISLTADPVEPGDAPMRECPECHSWLYLFHNPCPKCGHTFLVKEKPKVQIGSIERFKSPDERKQFKKYQNLLRMAVRKGFVPGYASEVFKKEFGNYPPKEWRLHCIYGHEPTQDNKKAFWAYLGTLCKTRQKTQEWRVVEYQQEFGANENPFMLETIAVASP